MMKSTIYSLLNILTIGKGIPRKINGFKVYFPPRWSRYFEADYENENIAFLKANCREGMIVIDIGAHLGLISTITGQLVKPSGKVYAFEPTPQTFKTLKQIVQLNNLSENVICVNQAVSDSNGEIDFFIDNNEGSNANSLVHRSDRNRTSLKIKTTTIDSFTKDNNIEMLNLIKIDAEGVEYSVLKGAKESINKFKPKIILALHPTLITNNNNTLEDIYKLIEELKYTVFYQEKTLDIRTFCNKTDLFDVHLLPV
jgi:FkbM family methyltransferase